MPRTRKLHTFYSKQFQMQIRLEVGARIAPSPLVPFPIEVVEIDQEGVVLSLGGESEVYIGYDDWATGLASIGHWQGTEYVVQSGGQNLVDEEVPSSPRSRSRAPSPIPVLSPGRGRSLSSPVTGADSPVTYVFFRIASLEQTREVYASFDREEETNYDGRLGFRFRASSEDKVLWDVTDPFAGFELSTVTTRDNDRDQDSAEVFLHGNAKYYVVQGLGEQVDGSYGIRVSEVLFGPEDLNRRCKACERTTESASSP